MTSYYIQQVNEELGLINPNETVKQEAIRFTNIMLMIVSIFIIIGFSFLILIESGLIKFN